MSQASSTELNEINKIKIITHPDRIFDNSLDILLINLTSEQLVQFQDEFLTNIDTPCNVYLYESKTYDPNEAEWLLGIFRSSSVSILNIDNVAPHLQEFVAYFLSKSSTFWLTNVSKPMYNHISKNRIYSFDFLQSIGGNFEKR